MRTIFITPLLWKRLDRAALRRGEEGQAVVLVALAAVAMVAMIGLAIDGAGGYLEATKLQRAADAAALAGVVWIPNQPDVADARAQLAAEAQGVKVACYYNPTAPGGTATTQEKQDYADYNARCRRTNFDKVQSGLPNEYYFFESSTPADSLGIRYKVKLAKLQPRAFLGIIGFPSYVIVRQSTAAYTSLVRFGSSFNYYGTNGVFNDHSIRCDLTNPADCAGSGGSLDMRGATWQRYVVMRCDQPNPPKTDANGKGGCVGGFWANINGTASNHANGDAYSPVRDGAASISGSSGPVSGKTVSDGNSKSRGCLAFADLTSPNSTWFVNDVYQNSNYAGNPCASTDGGLPVKNADFHPDRVSDGQGFGYEIGVNVDKDAIYSYQDTVDSGGQKFTNLNVTIYDAATTAMGSGNNNFTVRDEYQQTDNAWGDGPFRNYKNSQMNFATSNVNTNGTSDWKSKVLVCPPGGDAAACNGKANPNTTKRPTSDYTNDGVMADPSSNTSLFPDAYNTDYTYNDGRTRFTLYYPPNVPSIPSTYANVAGNRFDSFEVTEMTFVNLGTDAVPPRAMQNPPGTPPDGTGKYLPTSYSTDHCYYVFDDIKAQWNNTRILSSSNKPISATTDIFPPVGGSNTTPPPTGKGTGPDFAYQKVSNSYSAMPIQTRYAQVCPGYQASNNTTSNLISTDFRWNRLKGTPAARYNTTFTGSPDTIEPGILPTLSPAVAAPALEYSPVVSNVRGARLSNGSIVDSSVTNPRLAGSASVWTTPYQAVDTIQNCRPSAVDTDGWPLDAQWGVNRIPFNMIYADPLTNRAWKNTAGNAYYTAYYPFHGWRCEWDFDSSYKHNQLANSSLPPSASNPSLAMATRALAPNGKADQAFTLGHPGLVAQNYLKAVLGAGGASDPNIAKEVFPVNDFSDREFGLEPFFHLSNLSMSGGAAVPTPGKNSSNAEVRPGTYMLHVQVFGSSAANRYSVKAEYENPKKITYQVGGTSVVVNPVPNVFAITAMSLAALAKTGAGGQDNLFDLAFIPPDNAGLLAVLQLFDAGDFGGSSGTLQIGVLEPSMYGPRLKYNGSQPVDASGNWQWELPKGDPIPTKLTACPFSLNVDSLGLGVGCATSTFGSSANSWVATNNGSQYYNDQWMLMSFNLPTASRYATFKQNCAINNVPESLCYFFQINYRLTGGATINDTTTWQLIVQGQPVHLVVED